MLFRRHRDAKYIGGGDSALNLSSSSQQNEITRIASMSRLNLLGNSVKNVNNSFFLVVDVFMLSFFSMSHQEILQLSFLEYLDILFDG